MNKRPVHPTPVFGPWTAHINALAHGYEIVLVRRNTELPNNRERYADPYPCFTEWGALRRARRLTKARNRMQARLAARQAKIDALVSRGPAELLTPYLLDHKRPGSRP